MVERPLMVHCFMVDPLSNFSFQSVHLDWCSKGRGMCYPVCGMVHINALLLREYDDIVVAAGFVSCYLDGPLPYIRSHITVNKMC